MRDGIVFLLVLLLCGATFTYAQRDTPVSEPVERAAKTTGWLKEKLALSDAQSTKVQEILKNSYQQAEQDRSANQGNRRAMLKAAKARMESTDKEIGAVLTQEQMEKYAAVKTELRQKLQERWSAKRGMGM